MSVAPIDFRNVEKRYGDKLVVNGLSFNVKAGECYGLLGPNEIGRAHV